MKMPNGFGSVYKLSGKRRNPWMARKTVGWENNDETQQSKQLYVTIGYFPTRQEALTALVNYNENPYDIKADSITFEQVYDKWSAGYFPTLAGKSSIRTIACAYNYCKPLYKIRMKDIRVNHLEQTIKDATVGDSTKGRMKSLFNMIYRYAMKHEIVDKDYASLCDSIKKPKPQIVRIPFSDTEIATLWENTAFPFVDMVLVGIFSGFRPQELAVLKISDIDLEAKTITGGLKTDAGRNRVVPIHPLVSGIVKSNYDKSFSSGSLYLFNDEDGQQGTHLTYDKYRGRFTKIMKKLHMEHKPHDTRHTFITKAKAVNVDEYILKLIVGHAIEDITEKVYTHRTLEQLHHEIQKIKS